ncbi:Rnf111 [Symbiodinium sp. CCMP2592]|nr:Rnf111 [Symbiodinium sp. CCMP2592]
MATAIGDINVEAADTEIGQQAARRLTEVNVSGDTPEDPNTIGQPVTAAPASPPHATLRPASEGHTAPAQTAPEPNNNTLEQDGMPPSTLAPHDEDTTGDTTLAPDSVVSPRVPPTVFNEESARARPPSRAAPSGHDQYAEAVDGLAPPRPSPIAFPPSADSAGIAPMTPPVDCELTPQLRGVEYVLGANCLLPVTNCTSCLQPFEVGETLVRLVCMHYFHKECATRWFSSPIHGHRCPSCNVNLIGLDS